MVGAQKGKPGESNTPTQIHISVSPYPLTGSLLGPPMFVPEGKKGRQHRQPLPAWERHTSHPHLLLPPCFSQSFLTYLVVLRDPRILVVKEPTAGWAVGLEVVGRVV